MSAINDATVRSLIHAHELLTQSLKNMGIEQPVSLFLRSDEDLALLEKMLSEFLTRSGQLKGPPTTGRIPGTCCSIGGTKYFSAGFFKRAI